MNYNLLEEKWLPILWNDGNFDRVGIIEALRQARRIRQIAASNPMDRVAVLRFLLALLYWCQGNPPNKIPDGSFPRDWFKKLQDHKDCFNLLGDGRRFYQCKPESGKDEKLTANYLVQEIPTGTNFSHFKHSTDGINGLCRACCALGLLRLPAFATSGGRGKPPGINAKPPIYVIPLGSSLAETLCLSWRPISPPNWGTPAWEKPDLQLPKIGEVPLFTGLTWLPRHVWLENPEEPECHCISCGRKENLVRHCVFAGIGSTKSEGDRPWNDPHVVYDGKDMVVKPGNALGASDAAAGQWVKIMAGIQRRNKANRPPKLWVIGFDTVQNDKYLEAMEYEIPFSGDLDIQKVRENLEKFEVWQKEGKGLVKRIGKSKIEGSSVIAAIRPNVEVQVSTRASEMLTGVEEAWEQAAREYSPMLAMVAKSLAPGYTTAAVKRRKEIAGAKPNMRGAAKNSK